MTHPLDVVRARQQGLERQLSYRGYRVSRVRSSAQIIEDVRARGAFLRSRLRVLGNWDLEHLVVEALPRNPGFAPRRCGLRGAEWQSAMERSS